MIAARLLGWGSKGAFRLDPIYTGLVRQPINADGRVYSATGH